MWKNKDLTDCMILLDYLHILSFLQSHVEFEMEVLCEILESQDSIILIAI